MMQDEQRRKIKGLVRDILIGLIFTLLISWPTIIGYFFFLEEIEQVILLSWFWQFGLGWFVAGRSNPKNPY